ncbi:hypothetical protein F511_39418 [Dorcoceras hygrometricum]|uniref:Uncharacterized protein n=1 Tax=Dorcoceras hygrometricum TaxID=472368 RepID=A0A2Z7DC21_9LAMI|nr:hypothetical protein F511_39418 [Dorcoceras hygrometricum]
MVFEKVERVLFASGHVKSIWAFVRFQGNAEHHVHCRGGFEICPTILLENRGGSGSRLPTRQRKNKNWAGRRSIQFIIKHAMTIHRVFLEVTFLATRAWHRSVSRGNRHFTVGGGRLRQSGPRPESRLLRQPALEGLTRSARTDSPRQIGWNKFRRSKAAAAVAALSGGGDGFFERGEGTAT